MPKRVATPPPGDDEPEYLTVYRPYPHNANWELLADRIQFSRWIACCTTTEPFYAFFYKPRSRAMVILEIEKSYKGFDSLLGEHRWNEFLSNPSDEERNCVSQVFYCLYKTDREVQKDGWKRVNVQESWFQNWSPVNLIVSYPYPKTHWCMPPVEDRTTKPLCRPLPTMLFPPPPNFFAIPGSSGWVDSRSSNDKSAQASEKTRRPPSIRTPGANTVQGFRSGPSSASRAPNSPSTWTKTSSTVTSPHSAKTSTATPSPCTPLGSVMGNASTPSSSVHDPSSPLKSAPVSKKRSWWEETGREYDELEYGAGPSGFGDGDEFDGGAFAQMHISSKCIDDHFLGARNDPMDFIEPWEKDGDEIGIHYGVEGNQGGEDQGGSLWDEQPGPVKEGDEETLCPEHGNICKKGICAAYSEMVREKRRIAREQADEGKGKGKGKGKNRRKGKGKGKEMDEGTLDDITVSSQRGDDPWENATMSEL